MSTNIVVIDEPCGSGKSSGLIKDLKGAKITHPQERFLLVLPELGEVKRYLDELGRDWFIEPLAEEDDDFDNKIDALIQVMIEGKNIVTTHSLYTRIRRFQHLLHKYYVIIDEVPTAAQEVPTKFGRGVFQHLLFEKKYLSIDANTQLISINSNWWADEPDFVTGTDLDIKKFMTTVAFADVYFVNNTYQVMPLPDAFFTEPKSLTILTFLFEGTQLDYYMRKMNYARSIQSDPAALADFKVAMRKNLSVYSRSIAGRTGFKVMTEKNSQRRTQVGHFVKKAIREFRNNGQVVNVEDVLVASSKDAWFGVEKNSNSKVSKKTRLKSLTGLGKADWTAMVTRGTNKYREKKFLFLLGKLNMNPNMAEFLGMRTKEARNAFEISELIQLIYRTQIRDGKPVILATPDKANIVLLDHFLDA